MLIQIFVLKVMNNERKILTHHEMIDRMAEQKSANNQIFLPQAKFLNKIFHLSSLSFVL